MNKENNPGLKIDKIFKLLLDIAIVLVCLIAGILMYYIVSSQIHSKDPSYRPNISVYTIVSPSMDPVIKVYDVVINRKVSKPSDIQVGDIITYISTNPSSEGMTITHRVVEINKENDQNYEYRTQGDNNPNPDPTYVTFDNVLGKEVVIIPKLGKLQFLLANKKGWLFILLVPILIYIFIDIYKLITLLGLNQKVEKVVQQTEEEKKEIERRRQKEIERKEVIKRELQETPVEVLAIDEYAKNPLETPSFLMPYSENIYSLGVITETPMVIEEKPKEEVPPQKNIALIAVENAIVSPIIANELSMKKTPVEPEGIVELPDVEILDTDEITAAVKEYREKITELNNQIISLTKIREQEKLSYEKVEEERRALSEANRELELEKERVALEKETAAKAQAEAAADKERLAQAEAEVEKARLAQAEAEAEKARLAEAAEERARKAGEAARRAAEELAFDLPEEHVVETDNYLVGDKIKVVQEEPAKKPRKNVKKVEKPETTDIEMEPVEIKETKPRIVLKIEPTSLEKQRIDESTIELKSTSLYKNNREIKKMERPEGEDVTTINMELNAVKHRDSTSQTETNKKKQLNLKPNSVKRVRRANRRPNTTQGSKGKKVVQTAKTRRPTQPRKKEKFIRIEKRK